MKEVPQRYKNVGVLPGDHEIYLLFALGRADFHRLCRRWKSRAVGLCRPRHPNALGTRFFFLPLRARAIVVTESKSNGKSSLTSSVPPVSRGVISVPLHRVDGGG